MLFWVIYDISDNLLRSKVAERCKDYGLRRVQKSAFLGEFSRNSAEMLAVELREVLEDERSTAEDSIFLIPMCNPCFKKIIAIGREFREEDFRERGYAYFG
jgi:CRISPR-associated protein Cas2